jgi:phosphoserine phosphatase
MFTATLIADGTLNDAILSEAAQQIAMAGGKLTGIDWLGESFAGDIHFEKTLSFPDAPLSLLADALEPIGSHMGSHMDVIVQPTAEREKRVLVADMDSTMITVECIDELAHYAGIKPEIAAITERAMRGELDFGAALDARVALLAGMDEGVIERCLAERVRITPGAEVLVRTMRARGAVCVLVSGGFTRFAEPVARAIGFTGAVANVLEIADGRLTGRVARPIVGADRKVVELDRAAAEVGVGMEACLAVGDGANDLPMIRRAGLGVAYRAKPVVAAAAGARIEWGDLSALLYAQGIARTEWVEAL